MKLVSGKSVVFAESKRMKKWFMISVCVTIALFGCTAGTPEYFVKSISNKYYGIPFDKSWICEIRLSYWVKVREQGTYEGIVDSGIRKRILTITNPEVIHCILDELNVVERRPWTLGVKGDIVFVVYEEETWNAQFSSNGNDILLLSPGRYLQLRDDDFYNTCLSYCFETEKNIRGKNRRFCDARNFIALNRTDAEKLSIIGYNSCYDGGSEEVVYMPKIINEHAQKIRVDYDAYDFNLRDVYGDFFE